MHTINTTVSTFMKGVDQLGVGMVAMSDGVSQALAHANDSQISSDSCKLKEATNAITRADAPHSAVAKLRRDMNFNVIGPVQNHIANNRNLKVSLDIRRRRLTELNGAKKQYDDCVKRNLASHDKRFLQARANYESAKLTFNDVDRHVFEWLYILEEYRGDILDSTLQTLKYLQYEFFATSAHAISMSLPTRMEFRPMVEMTPRHLEAQVEMELRESEECGDDKEVADFSTRLIDKKARDDPGDEAPQLPVDPLSLSSLLSQGFEEGPARRALRLHQNDTQAAMDWLINGQNEVAEKQQQLQEGVRIPTTVKRVQKLNAMRKAQAEKKRQVERRRQEQDDRGRWDGGGRRDERSSARPPAKQQAQDEEEESDDEEEEEEDEEEDEEEPEQRPAASSAQSVAPPADLLNLMNLDEEPPPPTDFSRGVELVNLPLQVSFDDIMSKCEKVPLPAAVAAGISQPREATASSEATPAIGGTALAGIPPHLAAMVQSLANSSQFSPEQLIQAAQQLQAQQSAAGSSSQLPCGTNAPSSLPSSVGQAPMKAAPPPLSNLISSPAAPAVVNGAASSTPTGWAALQPTPASPTGWAALSRVPMTPPAASSTAAMASSMPAPALASAAANSVPSSMPLASGMMMQQPCDSGPPPAGLDSLDPFSAAYSSTPPAPAAPSLSPTATAAKRNAPKNDAFGDLVNFS
jgi:hypothetical protein